MSEADEKNKEILETHKNSEQNDPDQHVMKQIIEKNKEKDQEIQLLKESIDFSEKALGDSKTQLKKESKKTKQVEELLAKETQTHIFSRRD